MLSDHVEDVLTIPVTRLAEEGLFTVIVIGRVVAEFPRAAAIWERRVRRRDVPAGKRAGARFHVVFAVVERLIFADAHREQFEQFTAIILVHRHFVAFRVVQVIHHGRARGQPHEQVVEVAHAMLPEHGNHAAHFPAAIDFAMAGTKNHVPEKRHLLLELTRRVDHPVHPGLDVDFDGRSLIEARKVAHHHVFFDGRLRFRIE